MVFESWWGPVGFRVDVHTMEPRLGGALHYDMIADAPSQVAAMKKMGRPTSHETCGHFSEFKKHERLVLTHVIDFPARSEALRKHDRGRVLSRRATGTRMVVTLHPMHDATFSGMQVQGFSSQLTKLDERYKWSG